MQPPNEAARPPSTADAPTKDNTQILSGNAKPVNGCPAEALQLVQIIADHPNWLISTEHRRMVARMANRIIGRGVL